MPFGTCRRTDLGLYGIRALRSNLIRALPPNSPAHTTLPRSTGDKAGLTEPVVMLFMPLRITGAYHGEEKTKTIAAEDIDPTKNFVLNKKCPVNS